MILSGPTAIHAVRSDDRTVFVGALDFLYRLDEVFARDAQPHDQRAGDQDRRVDAEADADGQRQSKVVQGRAAEQQHGEHHQLRTAVRDDGPRYRADETA